MSLNHINLIEANALQEKPEKTFWKIIGGVEYYYYFAFFIIFAISCNQKRSVTLRMHQICFSQGLRPEPRWGAHDDPLESLIGWGREILSPHFPPRRRLRRLTLSLGDCFKNLGA